MQAVVQSCVPLLDLLLLGFLKVVLVHCCLCVLGCCILGERNYATLKTP